MNNKEIEIEMLRNEVEYLQKENDLLREHCKELMNILKNKVYGTNEFK